MVIMVIEKVTRELRVGSWDPSSAWLVLGHLPPAWRGPSFSPLYIQVALKGSVSRALIVLCCLPSK